VKTEVSPARAYRFGPFRLEIDPGSLFRDGEEIALTPKALALLRRFVERPGVVQSKQELIEHLWPGVHVEENNLNQQVATLRRALGEGWIETLPRRGFRFTGAVAPPAAVNPVPMRSVPRAIWILAALALALTAGLAVLAIGRQVEAPDPRAEEEYLAGRFAWNRRTRGDFQVAAAHFRRALAIDPEFAAAWSGLGDSLNLQGQADEGEKAARRALELDPSLAEAHATLGNVQLFRDWDLDAAERSFERAIELDPKYATARQWRAFLYAARGDAERAVEEIERARQIDPLSRILATDGAQILYLAREFERAEAQIQTVLRLDPHFGQAYNVYAEILAATGRPEEALAMQRKALEFGSEEAPVLAERLARLGRVDEARALLSRFESRPETLEYSIARAHFALGQLEPGFDWFDRALARRDSNLLLVRLDPAFDEVRRLPRWPEELR
jgi:DNA-binding winged helix-turn-helix (wHTH) protein/Tfp pilus assembly protein PilF